MTAVLGGLGAACAWAGTTLCAARATRLIGVWSVLACVMVTGLVITLPWALAQGVPELDAATVGWLLAAGVGNIVGLLFAYSGLKIGKVGVVAPIVSTEGAVTAVIAFLAGETLAPGTGVVLLVVVVGIALAGTGGGSEETTLVAHDVRAGLFGVAAALSFGTSLYATGHLSTELPLAWAVLPPRIVGVVVIAIPLTVSGRLKITRPALPLVVIAGVAEVVGFASFALGSRDEIAVSAVLASQFGALAAVAAYFVFRERLTRLQIVGVATIAVGVAVLSALQA